MDLNKLRGALAERRITQRDLAKQLGLSVKTINAKLNGRTPITVDEAYSIINIAKIQKPMEIFFGNNVAEMQRR